MQLVITFNFYFKKHFLKRRIIERNNLFSVFLLMTANIIPQITSNTQQTPYSTLSCFFLRHCLQMAFHCNARKKGRPSKLEQNSYRENKVETLDFKKI